MESFHPPKEVKEQIDDSALPQEEGISEKNRLEIVEWCPSRGAP